MTRFLTSRRFLRVLLILSCLLFVLFFTLFGVTAVAGWSGTGQVRITDHIEWVANIPHTILLFSVTLALAGSIIVLLLALFPPSEWE